jgi:hypothetical protein
LPGLGVAGVAAAAELWRSAIEDDAVVKVSLARLRELALAIPRPGCEWEERPHFDPPASSEEIAAFERAAGFPFPADLKTFFSEAGAVVGMSVHNGYWVGGIEQLTCALIHGDFPRSVSGEATVAVATDGGGNAFLLTSGGHIWFWNHETGNGSVVASSFTEFLDRVATDWAAFIANTPGWHYLV